MKEKPQTKENFIYKKKRRGARLIKSKRRRRILNYSPEKRRSGRRLISFYPATVNAEL